MTDENTAAEAEATEESTSSWLSDFWGGACLFAITVTCCLIALQIAGVL